MPSTPAIQPAQLHCQLLTQVLSAQPPSPSHHVAATAMQHRTVQLTALPSTVSQGASVQQLDGHYTIHVGVASHCQGCSDALECMHEKHGIRRMPSQVLSQKNCADSQAGTLCGGPVACAGQFGPRATEPQSKQGCQVPPSLKAQQSYRHACGPHVTPTTLTSIQYCQQYGILVPNNNPTFGGQLLQQYIWGPTPCRNTPCYYQDCAYAILP